MPAPDAGVPEGPAWEAVVMAMANHACAEVKQNGRATACASCVDISRDLLSAVIAPLRAALRPEREKSSALVLEGYRLRGLLGFRFRDRYDTRCSVQESSLAEEAAIWLGVDDAEPRVMARDAGSVGVETSETVGWVPYPIPEQVALRTRMHLTQAQLWALIPMLEYFAASGFLPSDPPTPAAAPTGPDA